MWCPEFRTAPRESSMGGCQNFGPFLCPLNTRCRIILRIHKRTILLTTTHMHAKELREERHIGPD